MSQSQRRRIRLHLIGRYAIHGFTFFHRRLPHPWQKLPHRLIPRSDFPFLNGPLKQQTRYRLRHRKGIGHHRIGNRLKISLAHQRIVAKHQKRPTVCALQHLTQSGRQFHRSCIFRHRQNRYPFRIVRHLPFIKPLVIQIVGRFLTDQIRHPQSLDQIAVRR